jgi:hypothetical protein
MNIFPICLRNVKRTLFFVLPLLACACSPELPPDKQKTQETYNRAKLTLLKSRELELDVVWILQDLVKISPDRKLNKLIKTRLRQSDTHPYRPMVDPAAPRIPLPSDPGQGIDRYFVYLQAPFGSPADLAVRYIEDYLSRPETGYILTHQFAVLLWAEQSGLELPDHITNRKSELLTQIYNEQVQQAHHVCVDLYAERVALLLRYGTVTKQEAFDWIGKLVTSQHEDGTWPPSTHILEYNGGKATARVPTSHTTALAMLALKSYLTFY